MDIKEIDLAKEFSSHPYGRYREDDNESSGETFRSDHLVPALRRYDRVVVNLSGTNNYNSSFMEEVFGGLVRAENFTKEELDKKLIVKHKLLPSLVEDARRYILAASEREQYRTSEQRDAERVGRSIRKETEHMKKHGTKEEAIAKLNELREFSDRFNSE